MVTKVTQELQYSNKEYVIADNKVYKINPEAYNFILSVSPFFELICFSNLPEKTLLTIIDHIEDQLNLPSQNIQSTNNSKSRL